MAKKKENSETRKFIKIRERNHWERECWNYYVVSDAPFLKKLKKYDSGNYRFNETLIDEKEVDKICKNSDGGYMNYHNKVIEYKKNTDNPKQPLYKGGCFVFERYNENE